MDLRKIPIFKNLSEDEIKEIQDIAAIEEKTFEKGSHIFKKGDIKEDFYYLVKGSIKVYKIDPEGKRYIIASFNKPVIFGEVYAYLKEPFDFWAEADKDSTVIVISDFRNLLKRLKFRSLGLNFIDLLARKSLSLSKKNQINSQSTLEQKIAAYILENEKGGVVHLNISREELADYLAVTRPSLSRSLSAMAKEGLINIKDRQITIENMEGLKSIV